jgi:hypothetical protein
MTDQLVASRVMKARHESECPVCRQPIRIGQLIAQTGFWQHAACLIDRQHEHEDSP